MLERPKAKSEDSEQVTFVSRVRFLYPQFAHNVMAIPNGSKRNPRTAAQLKRAGVLPGAPDLLIALTTADCPGLFIEMKRVRDGTVSVEQHQVHAALKAQGYMVVVAHGAEQAWNIFEQYVKQVAMKHG